MSDGDTHADTVDRRVCIDLFAGLGGFNQAFREADGWEVYEVEIREDFGPDLCADVMDLRPADLMELVGVDRDEIDVLVVLASPPCTEFSTAGNHDHWDMDAREPVHPDAREAVALVHHTVGLIESLAPDYWYLENPFGRMRWVLGEPAGKVTYCQYGRPYMKRIDLWGDHAPMTYRTCQRGGTCHEANVEYDGTSATRVLGDTPEERAKVPEELSEAILEAVEEAVNNPPPEQTKLVTDGGDSQNAEVKQFGTLQAQITGREFTDRVLRKLAEQDPDWVFVEVSGGGDSTGMLYAVDESEEIDVDAVVHLNTGIGAEFTRHYVREQCARLDLPYIEGIQPNKERRYAYRVILNGFPGPRPQVHEIHRISGKQDVEDKLVQSFDGEIVILTGVSRHESNRRKRNVAQSGIQDDPRHDNVTYGGPIAEYTGSEIREILRRHDVDPNDLADLMDSSAECLCGSFDSFWNLAYLWEIEPILVIGIWHLMALANQYWNEYLEEHGEPPYPRQYLVWGHGGVGRGTLSEMVIGELDDPGDFRDSDTEQRAQQADRDEEQVDLSNKCSSCEFPAVADGGSE